jgi:hypothetical protein
MTTEREVKGLRRKLNAAHASRDWHKKRAAALADKVRELKDGHRIGYEDGAKATTLTAYLAVSDWGLDGISWLTDRMRAAAAKKPPPYNKAMDEAATRSIIENMRKYSPKRAAEVEASFAAFLTGG